MNDAPSAKSNPAGSGSTSSAGATTSCEWQPYQARSITRSPGRTPVTRSPASTATPAASIPGTKGIGGLIW